MSESPAKTVLHDWHADNGARIVDFAGWQMPVQYGGALEEHQAVRTSCGIFDVSHMGNVLIQGEQAGAALDRLTTWPMSGLRHGAARYTVFLNKSGGAVDDLIVYRRDDDNYLIIWNASNHQKNLDWSKPVFAEYGVSVQDLTDRTALIAIQGPNWRDVTAAALPDLPMPDKRFTFTEADGGSSPIIIARTGYTGEDGVEIWMPDDQAVQAWTALVDAGAVPCGLAARDSLRIEAGLPLYGHELSDQIDPFEAGVKFVVKFDDREYIGRDALAARLDADNRRQLVGIRLLDRGVPREGYTLHDQHGNDIGTISSGSYSPILGAGIGLALVTPTGPDDLVGTRGTVQVRKKSIPIEFVNPPIHKA